MASVIREEEDTLQDRSQLQATPGPAENTRMCYLDRTLSALAVEKAGSSSRSPEKGTSGSPMIGSSGSPAISSSGSSTKATDAKKVGDTKQKENLR